MNCNHCNKPTSAKEFFEDYKKFVEYLETNKRLTAEQIQQYREYYFGLEMLSDKYDLQRKIYTIFYEFNEKLEDVIKILPAMEEILNDFYNDAERSLYLDKMNIKALSLIARLCIEQIEKIETSTNDFDASQTILQSVETATDNVFQLYANDKQEKFAEDENNQIPVEKIIYNYPDSVKVVKDIVTQKVFKNKLEKNKPTSFRSAGSEINVLLTVLKKDDQDTICYEKNFSYYDWAVMEAVTSLYLAGNTVIDLQSIDKVLKHNKTSRTAKSKKQQIQKSLLFDSLKRLCGNYITITTKGKRQEGYLIDGEFIIDDGRIYLSVKNVPILFHYANSINHVLTVKNDELKINLSYTNDTIAIYRYLMQRVIEIFGTLKMEDKKNQLPKSTNKILSSKICQAILCNDVKDIASKQRRIRERTILVLEEMKNNNFFSDFKVVEKGSETYYELKR